jgi:hypothetical protein
VSPSQNIISFGVWRIIVQKGSTCSDTCLQMRHDLKLWYCYLVFTYTVFDKIFITTTTDITEQYTYLFIHSIGMCRMRRFVSILRSFFHPSLLHIFMKRYKLTTWKEILKILLMVVYFKMLCSYFFCGSFIRYFYLCCVFCGCSGFPMAYICRFCGVPLNRRCAFHSYCSLLTTFHGHFFFHTNINCVIAIR